MTANPNARTYLYEGWVNYYQPTPTSNKKRSALQKYDWDDAMISERKYWDKLADQASRVRQREPGTMSYIKHLMGITKQTVCDLTSPIFTIPVGSALRALRHRLFNPLPQDNFIGKDGNILRFDDIFLNPYVNWPKIWPENPEAIDNLQKQDPEKRTR